MPQNDRNSRNRKRRRAYDQARDDRRGGQSTQRRSSAGAGSDLGYSGYAGYSSGGHPITNPNYDPDAPRPSRYTERTVNYGSYPDNSITFPTGGRSSQSGAQRQILNRSLGVVGNDRSRDSSPCQYSWGPGRHILQLWFAAVPQKWSGQHLHPIL